MSDAYNLRPRWWGLPAIGKLPGHLVIATSDVGLPSEMCPNADIVDLAGLHETTIAHTRFDATWFFSHYCPDIIYQPQAAYLDTIAEIEANPTFRQKYDFFPEKGELAIAIRRDSPCYARLRAIVGTKVVCPVGDDITLGSDEGTQDAPENYRDLLAGLLENKPEYALTAPLAYPGATIDQIKSSALAPLRAYHPSVVLLEAGTNDANPQSGETPVQAIHKLQVLITGIHKTDPGVLVRVSSLPPLTATNTIHADPQWVRQFNRMLPAAAQNSNAIYVNAGGSVGLQDLDPGGVQPALLGYTKMALAWQSALNGG